MPSHKLCAFIFASVYQVAFEYANLFLTLSICAHLLSLNAHFALLLTRSATLGNFYSRLSTRIFFSSSSFISVSKWLRKCHTINTGVSNNVKTKTIVITFDFMEMFRNCENYNICMPSNHLSHLLASKLTRNGFCSTAVEYFIQYIMGKYSA